MNEQEIIVDRLKHIEEDNQMMKGTLNQISDHLNHIDDSLDEIRQLIEERNAFSRSLAACKVEF